MKKTLVVSICILVIAGLGWFLFISPTHTNNSASTPTSPSIDQTFLKDPCGELPVYLGWKKTIPIEVFRPFEQRVQSMINDYEKIYDLFIHKKPSPDRDRLLKEFALEDALNRSPISCEWVTDVFDLKVCTAAKQNDTSKIDTIFAGEKSDPGALVDAAFLKAWINKDLNGFKQKYGEQAAMKYNTMINFTTYKNNLPSPNAVSFLGDVDKEIIKPIFIYYKTPTDDKKHKIQAFLDRVLRQSCYNLTSPKK